VDEAHGAHLSFHDDLPRGAIAAGADLVIQSTHKTLAALTQASMLHLQSHRVNRDRLRQALQLTQSTSPSYLLLASLDAARQQMATTGKALIGKTLQIAQTVRSRLSDLKSLTVLSDQDLAVTSAPFFLDPTRIAVNLSALGITGFAADELLHEALGVTAELPTLRQLTFILSLGNTEADGDRLGQALATLVERSPALPPALPSPLERASQAVPLISMPPITPRAAFFANTRTVGRAEAVGQLCADVVCPYPPGIPVLLPGEVVTETAIAQLQQIHHAGGVITGSLDDDCQTIRIITST
jgi:arginine/lysine/ornithine decarboxylase